ncbi:MAG: ROK family transcriptional regulator [Treponema sp.]|jgi:predicted NBD/HSP70 family sugar kinase|nr:ROK family transcriptional regulator [Treponema sp.]
MLTEFGSQDQNTIKYNNTKMVLNIIRTASGISRSEIARMTGMSPTSATRIVSDLQEMGLVKETTTSTSGGVGRKAVLLDINAESFHCAGIDISQKELLIGIVNFRGTILSTHTERIRRDPQDGITMARQIHDMYKKVLAKSYIPESSVKAVGIGTIGTVDIKSGTVLYADLLQWSNVPIRRYAEDLFGIPVSVDNEVKCALLGEIRAGNISENDDTVYITFGRGIGGAIYNNGSLVRGISNYAGEIGHAIVDYSDGRLCPCGRRGCSAAYLSEERIISKIKEVAPRISSIDELMSSFQKGEAWAIPQVERICDYISIVLSNTICYLNPANIIMGGSLIDKHPFLFDLSTAKYNNTCYEPLRISTKFKQSVLKSNSTLAGSALMAIEDYLNRRLTDLITL